MVSNLTIGIYGVSSQSGMAYLADLVSRGYSVIGYARSTEHGKTIVDAINRRKGIWLERPTNQNKEPSRLVDIKENEVTHDLKKMIRKSDLIIVAIPTHYYDDAFTAMRDSYLKEKRIPVILSPSRTFASPYIWKIVDAEYPLVCFSTSPYSCKTIGADQVYIKRRKRTWQASLEGSVSDDQAKIIRDLFPQVALCKTPALTSLNNIGAIFHPGAYLMNYEEIQKRQKLGVPFSFYIEGIAQQPEIAGTIEEIDQIRLKIANGLGIETFGLESDPKEEAWRKLTNGLRALEEEHESDIEVLRLIRRQFLESIYGHVISAQHWLDLTYGVQRIPRESLGDAIARTPTYQKMSLPQFRYVEEDVPTGLVPLEALANMLSIEHKVITDLIDKYENLFGVQARETGRNLRGFSESYTRDYLLGKI